MNTNKLLENVTNAIAALDSESEEFTAVKYMREHNIKDVSNMRYFINAGAYLETIRNMCLDDIEAAEAKKQGRSSFLAAIKKFAKEAAKQEAKPALKYAWKLPDGRYATCTVYMLLITESPDGLNVHDDDGKYDAEFIRNIAQREEAEYLDKTTRLPELPKFAAWLKNEQARASKFDKDKIVFHADGISFDGKMLELAMRLTGCTEAAYRNAGSIAKFQGNGQTVYLMPTKRTTDQQPTQID